MKYMEKIWFLSNETSRYIVESCKNMKEVSKISSHFFSQDVW
jgi:hypothetical protein